VLFPVPLLGRQEQPTGAAVTVSAQETNAQQSNSAFNLPAGAPAGTGQLLGKILPN